MVMTMEDDVKRWTAKRKAALDVALAQVPRPWFVAGGSEVLQPARQKVLLMLYINF